VHRRRSLALYLPASLRKRDQEEETHRGLTTHSGPSRENTLQTLRRGAHLHQPKGVVRGDIWAQYIPSLCTSAAGPAGVGLPGGFGRHQKLDQQVAAGYDPPSDPAATLRGKRDFFGYALHTQRPEHLGRQVEPQPPLFRLGAHPFFPRPNTKPSTSPSQHHHPHPSLRPPGHRGSGRPPLPLSHRHGKPGPSWKPLPSQESQTSWPTEMGLILVIPTPAQAGLVLRHLRRAPSDAAVVVPDWPAKPWQQPSMWAAATTISLAGPVWRRARQTEKVPYYEDSPWAGAFSSSTDGPRRRFQPGGVLCRTNALWKIPRGSQRSVSFGTRTRSNDVVRLRLYVGTISRLLWHESLSPAGLGRNYRVLPRVSIYAG
jgi:hypothetical protein